MKRGTLLADEGPRSRAKPVDSMADFPICPECRSGKHRNCPGDAWDQEADEAVPCPCEQALHDPAEAKRIKDEREFLAMLHGGDSPPTRPVVVDPPSSPPPYGTDHTGASTHTQASPGTPTPKWARP